MEWIAQMQIATGMTLAVTIFLNIKLWEKVKLIRWVLDTDIKDSPKNAFLELISNELILISYVKKFIDFFETI